MSERKNIDILTRDYEVSIWTLQDSYITTLKWSGIEHNGLIQGGKLGIKDDGEKTLEFNIPMYLYYRDGDLMRKKENPIWFNSHNDLVMRNLRKIKVIFNKTMGTEEEKLAAGEKVFDFLITLVDDSHEGGNTICHVVCEDLAFNELGKVGYKIALNKDVFLNEYTEWQKSVNSTLPTTEPHATLDYWCQKAGLVKDSGEDRLATQWYYRVEMNWSSYDNAALRTTDTIYEEPYVSSWNSDLTPASVEVYKEKERIIDIEGSNVYNITQTIAETFNVFCRYEYGYDENYCINSRTIVFYNSHIYDLKGFYSLTYPYNSDTISRSLDGTNITTKLFIRPVEESDTLEGTANIINTEANDMMEDYIFNFDYLQESGAITEELLDAIAKFKVNVRQINEELAPALRARSAYENEKRDHEAKKKVLEESKIADEKLIVANSDLRDSIALEEFLLDGYIHVDETNPDLKIISKDPDTHRYLIGFTYANKGIDTSSIRIFRTYDNILKLLADEVTGFAFEFDEEYGNIKRIIKIRPDGDNARVYLTYNYDPKLYYDAVIKSWQTKLENDRAQYDEHDRAIILIEENLTALNTFIDIALAAKATLIHEFECELGPALREGYWLPEDYVEHAESKHLELGLTGTLNGTISNDAGREAILDWDDKLFDDEEDIFYYSGIDASETTKVYYPYVNINGYFNTLAPFLGDRDKISFVYDSNYTGEIITDANRPQFTRNFVYGAEMRLAFVSHNNLVFPALVLIGAKGLGSAALAHMLDISLSKPRLSICTTVLDNQGNITINEVKKLTISAGLFGTFSNGYSVVYPRIKFSSTLLKTGKNDLLIKINSLVLEAYKDYYCLLRTTERNNAFYPEYFVTLKPSALCKVGVWQSNSVEVFYKLSNLGTHIYLDGIKVSEENSKPKVAYSIKIGLLDRSFSNLAYNKLCSLVLINDADLKLEEAYGYISEMSLDLDFPQNDEFVVKNYSTKFEDLFSSIMASTEAIKRLSGGINSILEGDVTLNDEALTSMLNNNLVLAKFDDYMETTDYIKDELGKMLKEAATILAGANNSLNSLSALTFENADMLLGFSLEVLKELAAKVYTILEGDPMPPNFKLGDIVIVKNGNLEVGRYIATGNSSMGGGYTRTYDGTLAGIKGANISIDAVKGLINIKAENLINMRSGGNIYIAANENVDIVGNKEINIGGTTINIGSGIGMGTIENVSINSAIFENKVCNVERDLYIFRYVNTGANINNWMLDGETVGSNLNSYGITYSSIDNSNPGPQAGIDIIAVHYNVNELAGSRATIVPSVASMGGINLVATGYTNVKNKDTLNVSKVLIHPDLIEMAAAKLLLKSSSTINLITSTGQLTSTAALHISSEDGIWMGTGNSNGLRLFSGGFDINNDGTINTNNALGASVELNADHLMFGFINAQKDNLNLPMGNGSVVEMTEDFIIMSVGLSARVDTNNNVLNILGTTNGLIGAKFTKDSIGFTTKIISGGKTLVNSALMSEYGVTVGSAEVNASTGEGGIDISVNTASLLGESGSFVRVAPEGVFIGSLGVLYVNTTNCKLITNNQIISTGNNGITVNTLFALGSDVRGITSNTNFSDLLTSAINNTSTIRFVVSLLGAFINGDIYARNGYFRGTLNAANLYVDDKPWNEYFKDPVNTVQSTLIGLWGEAGAIISAGAKSLTDINNLNINNTDYLNQFKEDIAANLTPNTYTDYDNTGDFRRSNSDGLAPYFKTGDIWIHHAAIPNPSAGADLFTYIQNTYVATCDWDKLYWKYKDGTTTKTGNTSGIEAGSNAALSSIGGWTITLSGRLAGITGASINCDSVNGIFEITAEHTMSLLCKGKIDITGRDVEVTGNLTLKLGGPSIELASYTPADNDEVYGRSNAGITLVTTYGAYTDEDGNSVAAGKSIVKVNPTGIELAAKNGIEIRSAKGIKIYASNNTNDTTAAVEISRDKGVWIGAGKSVTLYSGSDGEGTVKGASFLMTPDRLIFGVGENHPLSSTHDGSVVDLTKDEIILAVGKGVLSLKDLEETQGIDKITNSSIAGIQIKNDYIGMALGGENTNSSRSLISMKPERILIGSASLRITEDSFVEEHGFNIGSNNNPTYTGSYILIKNERNSNALFEIGSTGIFRVLAPNLIINSAATNNDYNLCISSVGSTNWGNYGSYIDPNAPDDLKKYITGIRYSANGGLEVRGNINAYGGKIGAITIYPTYLLSVINFTENNVSYKGKLDISGNTESDYFIKAYVNDSQDNPLNNKGSDRFAINNNGDVIIGHKAYIGNINHGSYCILTGKPRNIVVGTDNGDLYTYQNVRLLIAGESNVNNDNDLDGLGTFYIRDNGAVFGKVFLVEGGVPVAINGETIVKKVYSRLSSTSIRIGNYCGMSRNNSSPRLWAGSGDTDDDDIHKNLAEFRVTLNGTIHFDGPLRRNGERAILIHEFIGENGQEIEFDSNNSQITVIGAYFYDKTDEGWIQRRVNFTNADTYRYTRIISNTSGTLGIGIYNKLGTNLSDDTGLIRYFTTSLSEDVTNHLVTLTFNGIMKGSTNVTSTELLYGNRNDVISNLAYVTISTLSTYEAGRSLGWSTGYLAGWKACYALLSLIDDAYYGGSETYWSCDHEGALGHYYTPLGNSRSDCYTHSSSAPPFIPTMPST